MHAKVIRVLRFCGLVIIIVSASVPSNLSHLCCITTQEEDHETAIIINHNYDRQEGGDVARVNISPMITASVKSRHRPQ